MRALLLLALLAAFCSGCCCASAGPDLSGSAYRAAARASYSPGYRRPCSTPYRPIDSAALP